MAFLTEPVARAIAHAYGNVDLGRLHDELALLAFCGERATVR